MYASVGDRLRIVGKHAGNRARSGVVREVHGKNGEPPYVVLWEDGHETTFFPGPDVVVDGGTNGAPPAPAAAHPVGA
jgi:Domain of unknown function (DUF1918)